MRWKLPKADVVLECKLDPVDYLWNFWNHSQNCDPYEILEEEKGINTA